MKKSMTLPSMNQNLKSFINCWIWRFTRWLCKAISSLESKLNLISYRKTNIPSFRKYSSADLLTYPIKGFSWLGEVVILIVNKLGKIQSNWLSRRDLNLDNWYRKLICGKAGVHLEWHCIQIIHKSLLLAEISARLKQLKIVRGI